MRAALQRVSRASVMVDGITVGAIQHGLLVYAAAALDDGPADVAYVAEKVSQMRVFTDEAGKMNLSVAQVSGAILLVSAFTLLADARKGRRPSFDASAPGEVAAPLIEQLRLKLCEAGLRVETGRFAAHMLVESVNDGPICVLVDSKRLL